MDGELIEFIDFYLYKSLDNLAGSFSITTRKRLEIGRTIRILIGSLVCLDGYIEISTSSMNFNGLRFTSSGRDKTGDIVDSCIETKEIKNQPLQSAVQGLIKDLQIKCKTDETFKLSLKPNPGDTIFNALKKVLHPKDIYLFTRNGDLHLNSLKSEVKPEYTFEEGKNILSIEYTENHTERFKNYVGKRVLGFFQEHTPKDVLIADDEIKRPRRLVLISESPQTECKQQKDLRKAKSKTITLTAMGYLQDNKLFEVGKMAQVISKSVGILENFIINSVTINVSKNERKVTTLELISPNTLKTPKIEKAASPWDIH